MWQTRSDTTKRAFEFRSPPTTFLRRRAPRRGGPLRARQAARERARSPTSTPTSRSSSTCSSRMAAIRCRRARERQREDLHGGRKARGVSRRALLGRGDGAPRRPRSGHVPARAAAPEARRRRDRRARARRRLRARARLRLPGHERRPGADRLPRDPPRDHPRRRRHAAAAAARRPRPGDAPAAPRRAARRGGGTRDRPRRRGRRDRDRRPADEALALAARLAEMPAPGSAADQALPCRRAGHERWRRGSRSSGRRRSKRSPSPRPARA